MQMVLPSALAAPSVEHSLAIILWRVPQVIRLPQPRRSLGLGGKGIEKLLVYYHSVNSLTVNLVILSNLSVVRFL